MDEPEDPLQLYRRMQAIEFREARQTAIKRRVFTALQQASKAPGRRHYEFVLSCKVFKAIMLTAMQSDQFATRLRRVYVRILLRTHFQAVRTHSKQAQQERQERVGAVEAGRKRAALRFLRGVVCRKRRQGSKQKLGLERQFREPFRSTETQFNPQRELSPYAPRSSTQVDFGRNLEESRRSGQSIYSAYDMSWTRRKLVAVKQAPMLPILLAVEEKPENDSQLQTQQPSHRTSSSRLQPLSPDSQAATSEKLIGLANAITPPPQPVAAPTAPNAPDLKEAKEAKDSVATYRNEILQLLSMVKLTEILTLTDIVDQASGGTKADCHLAERGLISQSRRMLQRIISMQ